MKQEIIAQTIQIPSTHWCSSGNGSDVIFRKSLLILSDSYLNNLSKACCQNLDQFRNTVQRKQGMLEMRGREWGRKYIKVYRVCVCWQKCDHPSKCYWRFAKSNAVHPTRPKHSMSLFSTSDNQHTHDNTPTPQFWTIIIIKNCFLNQDFCFVSQETFLDIFKTK